MEVTVALDARYAVAPDGSAWTQAGMARRFWERYLEVFDTVRVVARAVPVGRVPEGWLPVNGSNIFFHGVPNYYGPWQYMKQYRRVQAAIGCAVPSRGAVILRVGSQVANCLERMLNRRGRPYALEVLGDPYEVFAPGVVDHPLRWLFRWHFARQLRKQCMRACGVAYVTRTALQRRSPAGAMSSSVSDVDLPDEAVLGGMTYTHYSSIELDLAGIADTVRKPKQHGPYRIVTVGSLAQLYKGTDVLIEAVANCVRAGLDVTALVVGDGKYRQSLMGLADRLGVGSRIEFAGQLTGGAPVRLILDTGDLFVLPSRTEGLPRAMIEAMARALPCIGSSVGGIPELLDAEDLVMPGDAQGLATKIQEVLKDPHRMQSMSRRNRETSMQYRDSVLAERRRRFYTHVRDCVNDWESRRVK